MSPEELQGLIALGEPRGVELKGPMAVKDQAVTKVMRAAMALSNRRDGGYIILGVAERKGSAPSLIGLSPEQADSWTYDDIADKFDQFAEPRIVFSVERVEHFSKTVVVLQIAEFKDIPIICKRDSPDTTAGACYVYPVGKAQVRSVPTQQDMRDLLDLAADKRLRQILAQVGRAGGRVTADDGRTGLDDQIRDFFER